MSPSNLVRAPSLFLSHGTGPFPLLDPEQESYREMIRKHASKLDGVKGILLFSAHWETEEPRITASNDPGIYYDYEDMRDMLPPAAFKFQYAACGNAILAAEVADRLRDCGFNPILDYQRGFDHSVYVPMTLLRPQGDIPIVQMSILRGQDEEDSTQKNIKLGQAVECFRDAGYAVIGSGGSYHDFRAIANAFFSNAPIPAGPEKFEDFLLSAATIVDPVQRETVLLKWRGHSASIIAHPVGEAEHLMPFMIVAGSGGNRAGVRFDMFVYRGAPMSFYSW
ncbi:catalytic LigB subunit of putative aromatic ring-opening dioxygenase [Aspergillus caelatus]|uniref:Catalytic LigB subunit of putative aromatic ring-opening dioxygenase n=1 Tax=Aspergillus caelatus TaxID=61420 RepID=A0A5N7A9Z8_9EURO|nr:catalytic LigB subunit of putative aromatic ring-opening dioxygenase [Aspergillus caelatus]KAE8366545.1 catalytic LigB subunit of putative aromatic ring-opening dioxygenase [Aspergillus caelatus]